MSDYFPDPEKELIKKTMRRGGPMDTTKARLICERCGETVAFSLRQLARKKPVCPKCGPEAKLIKPKEGFIQYGE